MKILLINGSPHKSGATLEALAEIKKALLQEKAEILEYEIGTAPRYSCSGCGGCKEGDGCIHRDIDALIELFRIANAVIICTPTHYASAPGNLTSALSRLLFSSKKSVEHKPIGVGAVGRRGGLCEAIHDVKKLFEFASCPIISGIYPAILYAKDGDSAKYDDEGLENMRSLAKNVLYIARCIEAGYENGIFPPEEERAFKTDISSLSERSI